MWCNTTICLDDFAERLGSHDSNINYILRDRTERWKQCKHLTLTIVLRVVVLSPRQKYSATYFVAAQYMASAHCSLISLLIAMISLTWVHIDGRRSMAITESINGAITAFRSVSIVIASNNDYTESRCWACVVGHKFTLHGVRRKDSLLVPSFRGHRIYSVRHSWV